MQCSPEEKEERQKMQKEAQQRLEEQRKNEHAARLAELEAKKQADLLKAASKKR